MEEMIKFHTKLGTRGRVHIPKTIVEWYQLWEGTRIHCKIWAEEARNMERIYAQIRAGFYFTIPLNALRALEAHPGELLEITILEWLSPPEKKASDESN